MKSPPPGPHFTADELLRIRRATGPLACETEVRLIHHLALLCPDCWAAIWELPPLATGEALVAEPVVRALRRLGMPGELLFDFAPEHLGAISDACRTPLGFCHLLLEEAWLEVQRWPHDLPDLLYAAFGPIGGNGACLLAPREAHDLQARFCALLATAYSQAGQSDRAERALALAQAHLESGTGRQVFSPEAQEGRCSQAERRVASGCLPPSSTPGQTPSIRPPAAAGNLERPGIGGNRFDPLGVGQT